MGSTAAGFKENRRKYQSNEYIKDLGLNWMDFNFRQYDPQIGRFLGVDPLADLGGQDMYSPYAAMGNAPESMIDPDGLQMFKAPPGGYTKVDMALTDGSDGTPTAGGGGALAGVTGNPMWGDGLSGDILDPFGLAPGVGFAANVARIEAKEKTKSMYQMLGEAAANPGSMVSNFGVGERDVIPMGTDEYGNILYYYPLAKTVGVYSKASDPNVGALPAIAELVVGSNAFKINADAVELSTRSDGSRDWAGYAGYSWQMIKANDMTAGYGSLGSYRTQGSSSRAAKGVGNSSKVLLNTSRQLQAKFKHAGDFGVVGNYSKTNAAKFNSALNQHINSSGTQIIQGAYRNASNPVTFYLNPQTGLNVIASPSGQFISGAALSPAQVQGILTKGFLW